VTDQEKEVMRQAQSNAPSTAPKSDKKSKNTKSVSLTADELKQQTSEQIGALATSVTNPMMAAVKKTASQKIMLETVQSMPDILADANAGLEDFFGSFEPETLAFDLTMNQLPQSAQLQLKAA
jgi:hypothetical protein